MDLNRLLDQAVQAGASDIHLKAGRPPLVRRDGAVAPLDGWEPLNDQNLLVALERVCADSPSKLQSFHDSGDLDLAYAAEGLPRFRVNAFRQRGAISFAFRVIPAKVPDFEELGLPPGVRRLA
jgi:twitching motility protein PilT